MSKGNWQMAKGISAFIVLATLTFLVPQLLLIYFDINVFSLMILAGALSWVFISVFIIPLIERIVNE